jgi:D-beta-D-heptose 7-phosphate kinase/D-beta-D-heptose 1-phosphate adenosyltransferase
MKNLPALLRKISRRKILVIGDVMLDRYIWGDATRISPEAPVPVIDIERESWTAGGAGNVALNIASLGARCTVAGCYGDDEAGRKLTAALAEKDHHPADPGTGQTIMKTRVMVQRQQLCRLDREAAPGAYRMTARQAEALLAPEIARCDAVILPTMPRGCSMTPSWPASPNSPTARASSLPSIRSRNGSWPSTA